MNILILSAGTRNKIVRYFKEKVGENGRVIATDMSEFAPAVYEADKFYQVPKITTEGYIDTILDICRKEEINGLFTLIDPELSLLAENKEKFDALGVTVIGSSYELCERAFDKMKMFRWLSDNGYKCARSYTDKEKFYADVEAGLITYPVFVKPICGSASISIAKVCDKQSIENLFDHDSDLMIQEYLNGQEIGADVYIDMISGEVVSIFTKKKLLMRAGETDKAVSFKDDKLFELVRRFAEESGWRGQIDIDIFDVDGEYYISEVNPRFGGGYPHAYECGCDHITMILNNIDGKANEKQIGRYEDDVYMMKYIELSIRRGEDCVAEKL
ncbi:MAG: ATP-grasp domain-containing protein [Clostridia bacterium]|nr:ATP-grasp domain-containing protein [Clostridia bacterium]